MAIDHRDTAGVLALIKKGADPNSENGLEFSPLDVAAASHQNDVVQALLTAGAKPDAKSAYGSALTFAAATANVDAAKLLLSRGANVNTTRGDGMTVLMMASNTGMPAFVGELLKRKADVKATDENDDTALTFAARQGNEKVAEMLLDAGATVDSPDSERQTPLMAAAMNGHADVVHLLLQKGANVNARDSKGRTALILAAAYGDYPEVVKTLIDAGADKNAKDAKGRTAATYAAARARNGSAALLPPATGVARTRTPNESILLSLKVLQSSMMEFNRMTSCISCHQEGLGRMATGAALARGFKIDQACDRAQSGRINGALNAMRPLHVQALKDPQAMKQVPLIEINEVNTADTWLLSGMAAHNQPPTEASAAMAMVLARQQSPDGHWGFSLPRVPMQSSFFTFTALAVRSLNVYGPKSHRAEIDGRIRRAKDWLLHAQPQNSEDRASRLLGLKWAGADQAARQKAAADVRADQRADGGWAQLPNLQSDAYATGQALYALHEGGGLPATDPIYKNGVQFLLRTQDEDGSWYVSKRALPANNYLDAGFPHGLSQYASFNGTCWATMALLETVTSNKRNAPARTR